MSVLRKRSTLIRAGLLLVTALTLAMFQNCSSKNFSAEPVSSNNPQGNPGTPGTPGYGEIPAFTLPIPCTTQLQQIMVPVKILFVVDVSGSNASNPGTDPNKMYRGGSIQAFFTDFRSKANFNWSFVTFKGLTATPLIASGMNPIFGNDMAMESAISAFSMTQDTGNTPYAAALDKAAQAIMGDMGTSQDKYVVVFISDGRPNPSISDAELTGKVQTILNAKPGQVSFNTIYYGDPDLEASTRLLNMSKVGNSGQFLDTNVTNGRSFPISNVVSVAGVTCGP